MAKDKKTSSVKSTNEENVMESIKSGNVLKGTAVESAIAEIEKEKDEKQKNEAKEAICVATYNNNKALLQLRARRREEKATKEHLAKSKDLLDRLLGKKDDGTEVPADQRLTPSDYKNERIKIDEEKRKACNESDKQLNDEMTELRNSYEGRYRYYWD